MKPLTATNEDNDSEMFSARDGTMPSFLFCLAAAVAGVSMLVGCDHTYYRSLSPSQTAQDCYSNETHEGVGCTGWSTMGMACEAPDGTVIPQNTFKVLGDYNTTSPGGEIVKPPKGGETHKYNRMVFGRPRFFIAPQAARLSVSLGLNVPVTCRFLRLNLCRKRLQP